MLDQPGEKLEVVVCTYSERLPVVHLQTLESLGQSLPMRRPHYIVGVSDIALARAYALAYCHKLRDWCKYVLLLDVDILSGPLAVQALRTALFEHPGAGLAVCSYTTRTGMSCISLSPNGAPWVMAGLGCAMVRTAAIPEPTLVAGSELVPGCVGSGQHPSRPGLWTSEDFWMCLELQAVDCGAAVVHRGWRP